MTYKSSDVFAVNYLRITAVVTAIIGLTLLFWPEQILNLFIPTANENFFVRFIGSALLGYSTLNFLTSRVEDRRMHQIALDANLVTLTIATILSIIGVASNVVTNFGWLLIGEHVVFTSLFVWARIVAAKTK